MQLKLLAKRLTVALLLFGLPFIVSAQQKTVTGKVTSEKDGSPVSGASVIAKGSSKGTRTGADGSFSLEVSAATKALVISSVNFTSREVNIGADNTADVALQAGNEGLTEVVVIGYGTARKKDLTGAVGSVKAKDFNQGVQTSPDQLIQGKVAGVQVTNNSGQPGGPTTIKIRGNSSLSAGAQPLFVIDGVIFDASTARPGLDFSGFGNATPSNPLNFINPSDIASMDVLKDASATAIYGSRGANGVVIVTTKKGNSGSPKLELGFSSGTSSVLKVLKVLDASQYKQALASYGLTNGDFGSTADAFKEITRIGKISNVNLAVSGGNEFAKYRFSSSYLNQSGIIKGSDFKKLTVGMNSQFKFLKSKNLGVDISLLYSKQDENLAAISTNVGFTGNLIGTALQWNPTRPLRKPDGSINNYFDGSTINPLEFVEGYNDKVASNNIIGSISPSYKILKNLEYKLIYGFNIGTSERRSFIKNWVNLENNGVNNDFPNGRGNATVGNGSLVTQTITNTINYNANITTKLSFNGLLGFEYFRKDNKGTSLTGRDFVGAGDVDYTDILSYGLNKAKRFSSFNRPVEEIQSVFSRLNFNYNGKYFLTATIRRDGSSKFGESNKYGVFPSFSAAWNISDEDFLKGNSFVNNLKLRIGWGLTGNQEFPSGSALARYAFNENNGGISLSQLANPTLKWQKDAQSNIGLDFTILKKRISGSVDYFNKTTSDLLFPGVAGQPGPPAVRWQNLDAKVVNKGFEIAVNASIIAKSNFSWDLGINATFISNKVTGLKAPVLTGGLFGQGMSGTLSQIITNDQPLNTFYTRDYQGIDKTTGQSIYVDNGNVFYNVGNPNPKKLLGITTTITYKKISLGANLNGAFGHKLYNNTNNSVIPIGNLGTRNIAASLFNSGESLTNPITASSRYIEKGDYLKLANTTLSYNFGSIGKNIAGLNVYITGQNLFVITKYTGFDPEVNTLNNANGVPSVGIDYIGYPSARSFIFGANINF
jgi:TonB-dependent starch-binding outer membrane protein SusC